MILFQQEHASPIDLAKKIKNDEDFMLVHKSLFEYLYGVYGCDYFIQAKKSNRNASNLSSNRRASMLGTTTRGENSLSATRADTTTS